MPFYCAVTGPRAPNGHGNFTAGYKEAQGTKIHSSSIEKYQNSDV